MRSLKNSRLGEQNYNKFGTIMKIVEYKNCDNMIVEFQDEHRYRTKTTYENFKKGKVRNLYDKTISGVGYIGVGVWKISINGVRTKAYNSWISMLKRCYSPNIRYEHRTYTDCFVAEEWHNFQNFAEWFYGHYYQCNEVLHVDKDLKIKGNKIYGPDTCLIVPDRINTLIVTNKSRRNGLPIGVRTQSDKYAVSYSNKHGNTVRVGSYDTAYEAFMAYKMAKETYIKQVADEYKNIIPHEVYEAVYKWTIEIDD